MLAVYKNQVFNAENIGGNKLNIWKYVAVEGFERKVTNSGQVYYESIIERSAVESCFSVKFLAEMDKRIFGISDINKDLIDIICDDYEYAMENGFVELERGVWINRKPLYSFSNFQMVKSIQDSSEKIIENISMEELTGMWNKYVSEVSI